MNPQETTEHIVQLLENIVERAHYINNHPEKELCLELDLIMEDLRWLYRAYATVKKDCLDRHVKTDHAGTGASRVSGPDGGDPHFDARSGEVPRTEQPAVPPAEPPVHMTSGEDVPADSPPGDKPQAGSPRSKVPPSEAPMEPTANHVSPQQEETGPEAPMEPTANHVSPQQEETGSEAPMEPTANHVPPQQEETGPEAPMEPTANHVLPQQEETGSEAREAVPKRQVSPEDNQRKSIIDLFSHSSGAIGEQFSADDNSLHQRISSHKEDRSISARMQQHPITNIKEAIGVNEKFLFINELFSGNIQAYHEAISALNSMDSLGAAFDHLNRLTKELNWDAKRSATTIEKLAGFVQRRYMDK